MDNRHPRRPAVRSHPARPHMVTVRLSDDEIRLLDHVVALAQDYGPLPAEWDRSSILRFSLTHLAAEIDKLWRKCVKGGGELEN